MRRPLRLLLAAAIAGSVAGCNILLGLDDFYPACDEPGCRTCADASDCGEPPLCAAWVCEKNVCTDEPAPAGTPCPLGVCDGALQCVGCVVAADCGASTECSIWTCEGGVCTRTLAAKGMPLGEQVGGDCKERQCDGKGGESDIVKDDDVPVIACVFGACASGMPLITPLAKGSSCDADGGKFCDGAGHCVPCTENIHCGAYPWMCNQAMYTCFSCGDGIENGDETDIDCGGDHCPKCKQGKGCVANADCAMGFCADGVCCSSACDEPCKACDQPGTVGICDARPKYAEDPSYGNGQSCLHADGLACTGYASCYLNLGFPCVANGDCASIKCADPDADGKKTCVKSPGDPCTQNSDCWNNLCTGGFCSP